MCSRNISRTVWASGGKFVCSTGTQPKVSIASLTSCRHEWRSPLVALMNISGRSEEVITPDRMAIWRFPDLGREKTCHYEQLKADLARTWRMFDLGDKSPEAGHDAVHQPRCQ